MHSTADKLDEQFASANPFARPQQNIEVYGNLPTAACFVIIFVCVLLGSIVIVEALRIITRCHQSIDPPQRLG